MLPVRRRCTMQRRSSVTGGASIRPASSAVSSFLFLSGPTRRVILDPAVLRYLFSLVLFLFVHVFILFPLLFLK